MYKVGIIGLGLMGGSLAKALSKVKDVEKIIVYDNNVEFLKKAKEEGYINDIANNIDDDNNTMKTIAAGGFKDITRIASANSNMWQNICSQNKIF